MEPHCALGKAKNLLVHVHNKIHQSNLNSFLEKNLAMYVELRIFAYLNYNRNFN